jgi:Bacterial Ig domain/FlgD Ig-like domain
MQLNAKSTTNGLMMIIKTITLILLGTAMLWALGVPSRLLAQSSPTLTLQQTSPGLFTLSWTSQAGVTYQPDYATVLDPFAPWTALGNPVSAAGSTAQITLTEPGTSPIFYRVRVLPDSGLPSAGIVSPTANQTVSGTITVVAGAAVPSGQLASVTLYLDGLPYQTKTSGNLTFYLNSAEYDNGVHQLYVVAGDNFGISYLGGNPDADPPSNLTASAPINLTFQNAVRWPDFCPIFDADMPITMQSDVFPTNYTIFVEDASGSTVRTWTGSTTDGNIQDYWDGNDSAGNPVPAGQAYWISLFLGDFSSPPSLQTALLSPTLASPAATTTATSTPLPKAAPGNGINTGLTITSCRRNRSRRLPCPRAPVRGTDSQRPRPPLPGTIPCASITAWDRPRPGARQPRPVRQV